MDGLAVLLQQAGQGDWAATLRDNGASLSMLQDLYEKGRPRLLNDLKELGVSKLAARQAIANSLGKMQRSGAAESSGDADEPKSGRAPPGYMSISLRMTGALGGDNWYALKTQTLEPGSSPSDSASHCSPALCACE